WHQKCTWHRKLKCYTLRFMNWYKNLRSNSSAKHTFIVLLVGFILIQVAGIYTVNIYTMSHRNQISRRELQRELIHTIRLMDHLPVALLQKNIKLLSQHGINSIAFADGPLKQAPVIESNKPADLKAFVNQHYFDFRASYQLKNGQWVVMRGGAHRIPYIVVGFVLSEILIFIILIVLCVWVVQRLAIPVSEFERATRRFGVDLQAPPLAMQGTAEMQAVIAAFNEMQGRIRRLIMDRTQMLAAISHDLRTPITRLQLRIEAMHDQPQYVKAEADLNEMERMISSILSFARDYVHSEQMERFDLNALIENICNELEDTGMAITFSSEQPRLPYFGRMTALKRAFTNLIENAVKYGDQAAVTIEPSTQDLKIKIRDKGTGIPESEMEKVFAPFYRVDPSRTPEKSGSGLGMAVARDIIRAHGGDIALHNHEQGGLLVLITLPLETDS
ncbi:MAG: hypothetical protein COB66_03785, partial [Coxiella sp. (in: Bacteria)]